MSLLGCDVRAFTSLDASRQFMAIMAMPSLTASPLNPKVTLLECIVLGGGGQKCCNLMSAFSALPPPKWQTF